MSIPAPDPAVERMLARRARVQRLARPIVAGLVALAAGFFVVGLAGGGASQLSAAWQVAEREDIEVRAARRAGFDEVAKEPSKLETSEKPVTASLFARVVTYGNRDGVSNEPAEEPASQTTAASRPAPINAAAKPAPIAAAKPASSPAAVKSTLSDLDSLGSEITSQLQ